MFDNKSRRKFEVVGQSPFEYVDDWKTTRTPKEALAKVGKSRGFMASDSYSFFRSRATVYDENGQQVWP